MAKTYFERLMEKFKEAPETPAASETPAETTPATSETPAETTPATSETPATPSTPVVPTNKHKLACLSAKHERFTYAYTKQSEFIIVDGESGRILRIREIAEQVIKWVKYGDKELAFLLQKNGKTTMIVFDGTALKTVENLDDINVVEREDGRYLEYTNEAGELCEAPLVTKPAKPVRKSTNLF